ncbi:hypothetical protein [Salinispora cortesiana]|uniref:hypothetical protein n=1 Tax=Salinispora cortesiana TaxID=1305843 RepID=UPI00316AE323
MARLYSDDEYRWQVDYSQYSAPGPYGCVEVQVVKSVVASAGGVLVCLVAAGLVVVAFQDRPAAPTTAWGPRLSTPVVEHTVFGVRSLMRAGRCAGGQLVAEERGIHEVGMCSIDGHQLTVAVFATNSQRDEWAGQMTSTGVVVTGDRWAAVGDEAAGPAAFAAALVR